MIGKILGPVAVRRTLPGAEQIRWVQVEWDGGILEAADLVGAAPGELVMVCTGPAAARMAAECPVEAAVTAVLDGGEKPVDKTRQKRL